MKNILTQGKKTVNFKSPAIWLVFGIFYLFIFGGCDDIIEPDLTNKEVFLTAPSDSVHTRFSTQTFYWEPVKGALYYHLRIVSPSFNRIEQITLDSTITDTRYTFNLVPGSYEWGVSAENGSSATAFFIRTLQVDSTSDLKSQKIELKSPNDPHIINRTSIQFKWVPFYNATKYELIIKQTDWNGQIVYDGYSTNDTLTVINLKNGTYVWGVKASNAYSITQNVNTRSILIDTIKPSASTLTSPIDTTLTVTWPVPLKWSRGTTDNLSKEHDSVFISRRLDFLPDSTYKYPADAQSYSLQKLGKDAIYYWKVKTYDEAGNSGDFTSVGRFKVKTL